MKINIFTDKNLASYIVRGWSEDKLVSGKIKTLTGRTFPISDVGEHDSVMMVKQKIEDQEGIPVSKQTLKKSQDHHGRQPATFTLFYFWGDDVTIVHQDISVTTRQDDGSREKKKVHWSDDTYKASKQEGDEDKESEDDNTLINDAQINDQTATHSYGNTVNTVSNNNDTVDKTPPPPPPPLSEWNSLYFLLMLFILVTLVSWSPFCIPYYSSRPAPVAKKISWKLLFWFFA